jgi:hypothetical protein
VTENSENLNELLSRFLDERQTHEAAEDIRAGEKLLASFSAPACDQAVINSIKEQIEVRLEARKRQKLVRSMFYRVAVAAVIIVLAIAGVKFFPGPKREQVAVGKVGQDFIWDDESGTGSDEQLTALAAQIDEIEASMLAIRLGENGAEGGTILTDLEVEMSEINGDFWKG